MAAPSAREEVPVETSCLAEHLGDPDLAIVDIRGSMKPGSAPRPHSASPGPTSQPFSHRRPRTRT